MRPTRWDTLRKSGPKAAWSRVRTALNTLSWLDFKLGLRMLGRYPGLTFVGGLAMAFGIASGAGAFQLLRDFTTLPLSYREQDRIVLLQYVSTLTTQDAPPDVHDFAAWREELRSVDHLSALRVRERNLAAGGAPVVPVSEAAVSAVAFGLVPRPLLGRGLLPSDEAGGAPPVAVLSYHLWQSSFGGSPGVVGRSIAIGGEAATVVGVMPEHFAFFVPREGFTLPAAQDLWVPFRLSPLDHPPGEGPDLTVFGRLAQGATVEAARAELGTAGARAAARWPQTHAQLKPEIRAFGSSVNPGEMLAVQGLFAAAALFLALFMATLCANVALLFFARAATREAEIAVRSALGASRGRIVFQLFAEALVLACVSIVAGLAGALAGTRWVVWLMESQAQAEGRAFPSWIDGSLSPTVVGYAVALALVGAVVAGVLPGLSVTRRDVRLQGAGGRGIGLRMGRVWTAVVIVQVALTVLVVPVAAGIALHTWGVRTRARGFPAAEHLSVTLRKDGLREEWGGVPARGSDTAALAAFQKEYRALQRRLADEPGVTGVTIARQLPGSWHPTPRFELDLPQGTPVPQGELSAQLASVEPDFFEVMGAPIVAGRGFTAADQGTDQRVLIVNESFVREILGGRNAVGRRVRFRPRSESDVPGRWYEIVGVARDLAMNVEPEHPTAAGMYQPMPGQTYPALMAVRVAGDPAGFRVRLREIAEEVAPGLQLHRPMPLREVAEGLLMAYDTWFLVVVLGGGMVLLLTNAGVYAIISFTVSRRTREIGVRVALGAHPRQVVSAVLARTARHVAIGVAAGAGAGLAAAFALSGGNWRPPLLAGTAIIIVYGALMMGVCMAACVVPMRRALRIQPSQALAADG